MTSAVYFIAEVLATYIETYLLFCVYNIFFDYRFHQKKQLIVTQLLILSITALVTIANFIALFSYYTLFIGIFFISCISLISYKTSLVTIRRGSSIAVTSIYYMTVYSLDLLSISTISMVFSTHTGQQLLEKHGAYRLLHLIIIKCVWIIVYLLLRKYIKKNSIMPEYIFYIFCISILVGVSSLFMSNSMLWSINTHSSKVAALWMSAIYVSVLFMAIWLAKKFTEVNQKQEIRHISAIISSKQENEMYHLSQVEKVYSKANHEMKNHFLVISKLIQDNKFEECKEYLKSCSKDNVFYSEFKKTGSEVVDIVLKSRLYISNEKGVAFNYKCCDLTNINIDPSDFCSILSNLIDNAIEACNHQDMATEKLIVVEIIKEIGFLKIKVSNTVDKSPLIENSEMITSKADKKMHGFGLQVVRDCVYKYHGALNYNYDEIENMFVVGLTLCL